MNRFIKIVALLSLLGISACTTADVVETRQYAVDARQWVHDLYYGPPKKVVIPPYDVTKERWCYRSLAAVDCYQRPQDLPAESLVAVYPDELFPYSKEAYQKALAKSKMEQRMLKPKVEEKPALKPVPKPSTQMKSSKPKNIKSLMKRTSKKSAPPKVKSKEAMRSK